MKRLYHNKQLSDPLVSFVLLDWSCRESFHVFQYLNDQTVPRDRYEIIWIEYYDRRAAEIENGLKQFEQQGQAPMLDQWIVLGMPKAVYYHKHLMYNVGILAARGKIVTLCDSDVMLKPTFVESIVDAFDPQKNPDFGESGIVLHHDEVRNVNKKFYPFNSPSFEDIAGEKCINWKDGKTTGLWDTEDPLHTRNYGACMSALRQDLVAVGGADEHIDYLGHICGPYELTFRLRNAEKKEIWHQGEFLYHTWHPGTDGAKNYMGPHDGRNISSTAFKARLTGRVMPLVENPAVRTLRLPAGEMDEEALLTQAVSERDLQDWDVEKLEKKTQVLPPTKTAFKVMIKKFFQRVIHFLKKPKTVKGFFRGGFISSYYFARHLVRSNKEHMDKCQQCLNELASENVQSFALFGMGEFAENLYELSRRGAVKLQAIFDYEEGKKFHHLRVQPLEALAGYTGKIVVGTQDDMESRVKALREFGVKLDQIVMLL